MSSRKRKIDETDKMGDDDETSQKCITVEPYRPVLRGPYPYLQPRKNCIRFTPTQIEAIKSGTQPGLTMVRYILYGKWE